MDESPHRAQHHRVPKAHPLLRRIGTRVRELREAKGWSQEHLAHVAGVDRSYMSGIERGIRNIGVVHLSKLAKALGVKVGSLCDD